MRQVELAAAQPLFKPCLGVKIRYNSGLRAGIQRRGSILAWIVILSVYGADTIAFDLSLSALISLIYEINYWGFKQF